MGLPTFLSIVEAVEKELPVRPVPRFVDEVYPLPRIADPPPPRRKHRRSRPASPPKT